MTRVKRGLAVSERVRESLASPGAVVDLSSFVSALVEDRQPSEEGESQPPGGGVLGEGAATEPGGVRRDWVTELVEIETLSVVSVRLVNVAVVEEYSADIDLWQSSAPIDVFRDPDKQGFVADGRHRLAAMKAKGLKYIHARVRPGGEREAMLFAVGCNTQHGLRRSNADKRQAVMLMLKDPEWSQWPDREIARQARVSHPYVGTLRKEIFEASLAESRLKESLSEEVVPTGAGPSSGPEGGVFVGGTGLESVLPGTPVMVRQSADDWFKPLQFSVTEASRVMRVQAGAVGRLAKTGTSGDEVIAAIQELSHSAELLMMSLRDARDAAKEGVKPVPTNRRSRKAPKPEGA